MYVCMYVCMYMCVCVCVCVYIKTRVVRSDSTPILISTPPYQLHNQHTLTNTITKKKAGHSFSGIQLTDGVMLSFDKYNQVLNVIAKPKDHRNPTDETDENTNNTKYLVQVRAGMRLRDLNTVLEKKWGLSLVNLGATAAQSVAGILYYIMYIYICIRGYICVFVYMCVLIASVCIFVYNCDYINI